MTLYIYQTQNNIRRCTACYYGQHAALIRKLFKIPDDVMEVDRS